MKSGHAGKSHHFTLIDAIVRQRRHMTYLEIEDAVNQDPDGYYIERAHLQTQLSTAVRGGLLVQVGKHKCGHCKSEHTAYGTTELGRTYHSERR